ncbi:MAG: SurA N-terminal domain-containing protein [Coriobacteriia bacterium]|nr:SurA N-terminal domain-containing protein [Coriobacteriia bacterium]
MPSFSLTKARFAGACAATALLSLALASCSQGPVAATVNGQPIYEEEVSQYVADTRATMDLTEESAWATYLITNANTPDGVRTSVLSFLQDAQILEQGAKEQGVTVTDQQVNEQIQGEKERFASDQEWQEHLKNQGYSEDQYRSAVRQNLLQATVTESISGKDQEASDADTLKYLQQYQEYFGTMKQYSQIQFSTKDRATAEKVMDQLNAGKVSFADAAKQHSTAESKDQGGAEGWDVLSTTLSEKGAEAVSKLGEGQVSDLVTDDSAIHLYTVTKVFTAPKKITKLSQMPDEAVELARGAVTATNRSNAFATWFNEKKQAATIEAQPMPEGLPYDVNLDEYQETANDSK